MENIEYNYTGTGLTKSEKKVAKKRFKEYRQQYSIESFSDLQLLENLVFRESLQERMLKKLEKLAENEETNDKNVIPRPIMSALDENLEQILTLKEKLGLFENKEQNDAFQAFKTLEKKFEVWLEENQGSRTLVCPHCSKIIMLLIRTNCWDAKKHPFFKDKVLFNEPAWKLYKAGTITKLDLARILLGKDVTSTDYIDWLEEHIKFE